MTDAQMLEQLDRTAFVPAVTEDLTPAQLEELELMSMNQIADLSADADDFDSYGRT
jgi:DNA-binding CsgD family transcriptional regulator